MQIYGRCNLCKKIQTFLNCTCGGKTVFPNSKDTEAKLRESEAKRAKLREAIKLHLRTVSQDWYVTEFSKLEVKGIDNGVSAMIHNHDLRKRAALSFQGLNEALAADAAESE